MYSRSIDINPAPGETEGDAGSPGACDAVVCPCLDSVHVRQLRPARFLDLPHALETRAAEDRYAAACTAWRSVVHTISCQTWVSRLRYRCDKMSFHYKIPL